VAGADPQIVSVLTYLNKFFNALAYNPPGPEEGFLFWGAWLSHIGPSLLTAQDAFGATPRAMLLATCAQLIALYQVELGNPSLGPILRLLNTADRIKYCGATAR
jgi:phospholipid/cholesterol/gamma-HCH transport system substrate-binding protein